MPSRKILFGLLTPAQGGHTRTALALADVLRQRGDHVEFVVSAETDAPGRPAAGSAALLRAGGFSVHAVPGPYTGFSRSPFREALRALVRRQAYDAIHWFELHAGVRDAALVAAAERRAFIWTVTSGGAPGGYHGFKRVAVYTQEVAVDVARRSPHTVVHLLPARIDFRPLDATFISDSHARIRARHGIQREDLLIVRVARCARVYLRGVRAGIELARRLNAAGRPAAFLHAGYVEDEEAAAEIRRLVDSANQAAGRRFAQSITQALEDGTRYAAAADVCIASGRTAIEALALGRPTLVVWGSHFLGLVDADNIEAMAETNFQGRKSEEMESEEVAVASIEHALRARLSRPERDCATRDACAGFVRARYSVESAADAYTALYADRSVSVEGPFRYYTNLNHAGREIYYRLPTGVRYSRIVNLLRRARRWPGLGQTE